MEDNIDLFSGLAESEQDLKEAIARYDKALNEEGHSPKFYEMISALKKTTLEVQKNMNIDGMRKILEQHERISRTA